MAVITVVVSMVSFVPGAWAAGGMETVTTCGAAVFSAHAETGVDDTVFCPPGTNIPPGMTIQTNPNTTVAAGTRASWEADAPAGLEIVAATIPTPDMYSFNVDNGTGWGGGFYWQGGGAQVSGTERGFGTFMRSSDFGFQIICGWSSCNGFSHPAQLTVETITLTAQETQDPLVVSPDGLWQASGWVRGTWPLHFYADSPSGVCSLFATLNGQRVSGADSSSVQNPTVWHQCAAPGVDPTVSTWVYGQGPVTLSLNATDAAGVPVSYTKTVDVDNSTPTVSFSGPTDAPSTAGTQYVTATAGGSPSGIDGFTCTVDGAASQWYGGATAGVPVSGVGVHTVRCAAADNAVDSGGNHGWSSWQSWTIKIGTPTVSAISFDRVANALRCHTVKKPVRKQGHARTVTRTRCHPRIVWRHKTVWVTVHRHGHTLRIKQTKRVRIVVPPHLVKSDRRRVPYGHGTTVNGWLGTADGIALGGQALTIVSAPDNGQGHFTPAAVVATASDGSWSAALPRGPSRIVEAIYSGTSTTEGSTSAQVNLVVPAKVELLRISPRRVAWGGTIHIVGRLVGGYLPSGGALVRLRIGVGKAVTTYGVKEHVTGSGRFSTTYTFGLGDPSVHQAYWFQVASLPMGNYPYAPADSRRLSVRVGGHPSSG